MTKRYTDKKTVDLFLPPSGREVARAQRVTEGARGSNGWHCLMIEITKPRALSLFASIREVVERKRNGAKVLENN